MKEAITEFCKVFAEKHLVPSVVSIVGAITALLFLPSDYWMITKIGKVLFFILAVCLIFLAIEFMAFCYHKLCAHKNSNEKEKYYNQSAARNEKQQMEELWTAVDKFAPDDRKLLKEFLENENTPIVRSSGSRYFGNSLLASDWVVSTEEYDDHAEEEPPIILPSHLKGKAIPICSDFVGRPLVVKYKLCDEIFAALKYSKEKYGKISHFE